MRFHKVRKRTLLGGGIALFVAVILVATLMPDFGGNSARALPPADLNRIARKNDNAAMDAAAELRARSAATAEAADRRQDAEERGAAVANATIARFGNEEPGTARSAPPR
jgi:hypothetical protein